MKVFYIPDGHRRYAEREGMSLTSAYEIGYRVLIDEIIYPLVTDVEATDIGVFLLSSLNIKRRAKPDLTELLDTLDRLIPRLRKEVEGLCSVCVFGRRGKYEMGGRAYFLPTLSLFVESDTDDPSPMGEVNLFIRSGGAMRLSGAPRSLIGPYTEMLPLESLHPDLRRSQILAAVMKYQQRYMAEAPHVPISSTVGIAGTLTEVNYVNGISQNQRLF